MADRVNVDIGGIRHIVEAMAQGESLAKFGGELIKEAVAQRLQQMTIAELIEVLNPEVISTQCNIDIDRIADLVVGHPPTNAEILKLGRYLRPVGITTKVLSDIRDKEFPNYQDAVTQCNHPEHPETVL